MNKSIVIAIIGTVCICMVMSSLSGGAGAALLQMLKGSGPPPNALEGGESVTYDNIPRAGDGCVVIYEHPDGQGANYGLCLDGESTASTSNLKDHEMDDKASAIDVGSGVIARLYPHPGFTGVPYIIDNQQFHNFSDINIPHDAFMSLVIRKK